MSYEITQDKFLRATLRHLSALRDAPVDTTSPFPEGWFDLPDRQLADLGAMFFLISMSSYHKKRPLAQVFSTLETPLRLSQYRIFRTDGFPRAFFTWAGFDHRTEWQFAVEHTPLRQDQWNNGTSLWVVDLAAPFGHLAQVVKMMAANRQTNRVRTLWHNKAGTRARVIEWSRQNFKSGISVTSYGQNQFAQQLDREG
jgi:hemolysin-activating ACP:hemolysin acyltransferase